MSETVMAFQEVVRSESELEALFKPPSERVQAKAIDHIDGYCRRFIAASPFVVVGTRGADGLLDLSPKGDPAGFVAVLDDRTLAIPDRPGNRRFDGFRNLFTDPAVSLLFAIPGHTDTLRVAGEGLVVRDQQLRDRLAFNGRAPDLALVVRVREAFLHCAKCMIRASMWKPEGWPDLSDVPRLSEAVGAHAKSSMPVEEAEASLARDYKERLY